jgi:hypothetical protein
MELVRTKTLVKNAIVQIDATAFRQWYEQHYGIHLGKVKKVRLHTTTSHTPRPVCCMFARVCVCVAFRFSMMSKQESR